MSVVMHTYRVWNGCGWDRVTTSDAVWRATPHFKGVTTACGAIGGVSIIGGGWAFAHGLPGEGWPHFGSGNVPFPGTDYRMSPGIGGQGIDTPAAGTPGGEFGSGGYGNGIVTSTPSHGPQEGCYGATCAPPDYHHKQDIPEPGTLALLGFAVILTIIAGLIVRHAKAVG